MGRGQALGAKLEFQQGMESTIEKGVKMHDRGDTIEGIRSRGYDRGEVRGAALARYGLEEDEEQMNAKTGLSHLRITLAALQGMFHVHEMPGAVLRGYADVFWSVGVRVLRLECGSACSGAWECVFWSVGVRVLERGSACSGAWECVFWSVGVLVNCQPGGEQGLRARVEGKGGE